MVLKTIISTTTAHDKYICSALIYGINVLEQVWAIERYGGACGRPYWRRWNNMDRARSPLCVGLCCWCHGLRCLWWSHSRGLDLVRWNNQLKTQQVEMITSRQSHTVSRWWPAMARRSIGTVKTRVEMSSGKASVADRETQSLMRRTIPNPIGIGRSWREKEGGDVLITSMNGVVSSLITNARWWKRRGK